MSAKVRDAILFFVGLAGIVYEAVVESGERVSLLIVYCAMLGLPAALLTDRRLTDRAPEDEPPRPSKPRSKPRARTHSPSSTSRPRPPRRS